MQWEYTETLSRKDLIQILRGMADSLEKKGFLEAWIGNTKINVDVGDIFILETTFNQDSEKSEVNFSLHLSWIPKEEKQKSDEKKIKKSKTKEVITSKAQKIITKKLTPEEIPVPEIKTKAKKSPADISNIPKPMHATETTVSEPPKPSIDKVKSKQKEEIISSKQQIPISPKSGIISDEIPVPPTGNKIKEDKKQKRGKDLTEKGLPTPHPPGPPKIEKQAAQTEQEVVIISTNLGAEREYVSAFNWSSSREWLDVSIQKDVTIPQSSPSDNADETEEDIFKELDEV